MNPAQFTHTELLRLLSERSAHILHILQFHEADLAATRMADFAARDAGLAALKNASAAAEKLVAMAEQSSQVHHPPEALE